MPLGTYVDDAALWYMCFPAQPLQLGAGIHKFEEPVSKMTLNAAWKEGGAVAQRHRVSQRHVSAATRELQRSNDELRETHSGAASRARWARSTARPRAC